MPVVFKKITKPAAEVVAKKPKLVPKKKLLDQTQVIKDQLSERVDALYESMMEGKTMRSQLAAMDAKLVGPKVEFIALVNQLIGVNETMVAEGEKHKIKVAVGGKSRAVKDIGLVSELLEEVQEGLFSDLCKIGLTDLDKYLTPNQLVKVLEYAQDEKSRSLTPVKED